MTRAPNPPCIAVSAPGSSGATCLIGPATAVLCHSNDAQALHVAAQGVSLEWHPAREA